QLMNQLAGNGAQRLKEFNTISRAKITAAALESIALHLTRIPGRKNLVWVSGSFPIAIGLQADSLNYQEREVRNFERELESATRALNQANIAIYPVDARGLISAGYDTETRDTEGRTVTSSTAQIDQNAFATMDTLADRTGGRVFRDTNDIAGAVGKALTDSELTYAISFYPTHGKWDGKFHDIKIRVNRPGVQLHYRKGYFAVADSPDNDAERKAALDSVIGSPVDITGLSILAEIMPPRDNASQVFGVAVVLDLHELMFTDSGDKKNGILDFVFLQQDAAGKDMQGDRRHAEFNMEPAKYQSVLQSGLLLTNHVTLGTEAVSLKIVVRDAKSGALGSLTVPLAPFRSPASK
ncbi:MAG TPA: VWA domain-containing protein, partial [Candidatus Acidoferrum sp.]